ncbi:hypothetical protein [Mesorhizobium sp.]|uniref:hypothetical protein n=1 Tax=Mesorhizobium sp. TaxID=1871066 RepID=UPI0025F6E205|nr:hypothetical protein [Mesorhizobium sp.]
MAGGFASDIVSQGNVPIYASLTGMSALSVPVGITAVRVNGYSTAGDGGGALYAKVAVQPSHAGKFQSADGAWWEIREKLIRPQMLGALGVGDDRPALLLFLSRLGNGIDGIIDLDHTISAELTISGKSNFRLSGLGTIKIANGTAVATGFGGILISGCTDFVLEDFTVDGNRANRVPAETTTHLVNIRSCSDFTIQRVKAINGTTDGFYFASSTPATKSTHSHDFAVIDCIADNNFRQGMSIVQGYNWRIEGGRYVNTNGTAPQAGIDLESNSGNPDHSIENGALVDVHFENNSGYGLQVSSESKPRNISVVRPRFIDNTLGAVTWGGYSGGKLIDAYISGGDDDLTRGVIDVGASPDVGHLQIIRPVFRNMTFGTGHYLIYVHSASAGNVHVDGLDVDTCFAVATINGDNCSMTNVNIRGITSNGGIQNSSTSDNLRIEGGVISGFVGAAVYMQGTNPIVRGLILNEPASNDSNGCIRIAAGSGARVERNVIRRAASAAGHGIRADVSFLSICDNIVEGFTGNALMLNGAAATEAVGIRRGNILNGVRDLQATATVDPVSLAPGQRTATATIAVAGAVLGDIAQASFSLNLGPIELVSWVSATNTVSYYFENPSAILSGSVTYDAPSIAAGAEVTTTVTVTGASLGDAVLGMSDGVDQAGLTISGYVSAANTVTAVVRNGSAAPVDLATATLRAVVLPVTATDVGSGTLKVRAEK